MLQRASAAVSENVDHISTAVSSHLLVCGSKAALIDASVAGCQEQLCAGIESSLGSLDLLEYILLTHVHFDHLGAVPYLRNKKPDLKLFTSDSAAEILKDRDLLAQLYQQNQEVSQAMNADFNFSPAQWMSYFEVSEVVGEGDSLDLGLGVNVRVLDLPGHTSDLVGYFITPDQILDAGEAVGGIFGRAQLSPAFCAGYRDYLKSLDRICDLQCHAINFSHSGVLRGNLVPEYLSEAKESAEKFYSQVRSRLRASETPKAIAQDLLGDWQAGRISPEGPFCNTQMIVIKDMVDTVSRELATTVDRRGSKHSKKDDRSKS